MLTLLFAAAALHATPVCSEPAFSTVADCVERAAANPATFSPSLLGFAREMDVPTLITGLQVQHSRPAVTERARSAVCQALSEKLHHVQELNEVELDELLEGVRIIAPQQSRCAQVLLNSLKQIQADDGNKAILEALNSVSPELRVRIGVALAERFDGEPFRAKRIKYDDKAVLPAAIVHDVWSYYLEHRNENDATRSEFVNEVVGVVASLPRFEPLLRELIQGAIDRGETPSLVDLRAYACHSADSKKEGVTDPFTTLVSWTLQPHPAAARRALDFVVLNPREVRLPKPALQRFRALLRQAIDERTSNGRLFASMLILTVSGPSDQYAGELKELARHHDAAVREEVFAWLARYMDENEDIQAFVTGFLKNATAPGGKEAIHILSRSAQPLGRNAWHAEVVLVWLFRLSKEQLNDPEIQRLLADTNGLWRAYFSTDFSFPRIDDTANLDFWCGNVSDWQEREDERQQQRDADLRAFDLTPPPDPPHDSDLFRPEPAIDPADDSIEVRAARLKQILETREALLVFAHGHQGGYPVPYDL